MGMCVLRSDAPLRRISRSYPRIAHGTLMVAVVLLVGASAAFAVRGGVSGAASPTPASFDGRELNSVPSGFQPYIYRESGEPADPVNLVFLTDDSAKVLEAVTSVLRWQPVKATPMMFRDRAVTRATARQFQVPLGGGVRLHLRVEAVKSADRQQYVLAAVHRDDPAVCGHIGSAFDDARSIVVHAFAEAGYHVRLAWQDNRRPGRQCDGSYTAGDGHVAIVDLTSR
jgi:hypothetical protein